jgi:hypothetical protein
MAAGETPSYYPGPAQMKLIRGGKHAGKIERKHLKRVQRLKRRRPQIVKGAHK